VVKVGKADLTCRGRTEIWLKIGLRLTRR